MNQDIDPELNYCPQCGDEYRPEIARCAACGLNLLSGGQMQARLEAERSRSSCTAQIHHGEAVVAVRKGPVAQIKELHAALLRCGIPSLAVKESGGQCSCRGTELLLHVRESDLPEVVDVLAREHRQRTGLSEHDTRFIGAVYNTEAAEAICPACGYQFVTSSTACPDCGLCFA